MSDIAKELFKSIVTNTASQEDFSSAIQQKMDQALDVRKAGITAGIYNKQVPSSETVVEESVDLEESAKNKVLAKDLEKLIKNPDPSRVKEYGGGTKYVDMLKSKLAKLQEAYSSDKKHTMDPKSHVELDKETGMYCVYNIKGKKVKEFESKEDAEEYAVKNHDALMKESVELEEASSGDIAKLLKFVAKNGAKLKGSVADFGGSKIEFSFDKGKIKFDGGKDSGVEYFDNLRDAISALSIGMED